MNADYSLEAINVSYTDEINEREIKGLQEFKKQNKKTHIHNKRHGKK